MAFALLLGLAVYLVASRLGRRFSVPATLVAGAVVGGALVAAAQTGDHEPVATLGVEGFLPLVAAWFVGDAAAARRQYQAGLVGQAEREQAVEAERARQKVREERVHIAQELHDVVAHTLAVITVKAGVGRRLMAQRPEEASEALESIEAIGRTAQEELQVVLDLLRDERVGSAALAPAPRLVDVKELVEEVREAGTETALSMTGTDRRLSPALELSLYRVVQEALTNVVKHAPGAQATVEVAVSASKVLIQVVDGGGPGQPDSKPLTGGHGIVGMRERMGAFGGTLVAERPPEGGFRVVAEVPVDGVSW